MALKIKGKKIVPLLTWEELTPLEQIEMENSKQDGMFFRFKDDVYDLSDFTKTEIKNWDGAMGETYWSGTLVRFLHDDENIEIGKFHYTDKDK